MGRCKEKGSKDCLELAAKISITLLRYGDIVPCDKCFYQVGFILCNSGVTRPESVFILSPLVAPSGTRAV